MVDPINKNDVTLSELMSNLREWSNFILKYKYTYLFASLIALISMFIFIKFDKPLYKAKTTFIIEETKSNNPSLGGLASIAGQFGVDVGGGSNSGILSNDNIIVYFKSQTLSKEVLLSNSGKSKITIAEEYINTYGLKQSWGEKFGLKNISFPQNIKLNNLTRLQDSLLQVISNRIIENEFFVNKTDKKSSFIDVSTLMRSENLAKLYCEKIVSLVIDKYVNLKIQRQKNSVEKLQKRSDSLLNLLQSKTFKSASLQNSNIVMDVNPLYKVQSNVAIESTLRDKTLLSTIFASVVQNLEIAKFSLSQETPIIQIIDSPVLPLVVKKNSKRKTFIIFLSIYCTIVTLFLTFKWIKIKSTL